MGVAPDAGGVTAGNVAAVDEDVGGVAEVVTGVIVTPVTFPDTAAFFFLLSVPRAMRVARAFAVAAARASTERG